MKASVTVKGVEGLGLRLAHWNRSVTSFERVWPKVERRFNLIVREQFATEGARGGNRWKPLTKKYAQWKSKRHPGKKILQLHGALLASLAGRTSDTHYNVTAKTWQKFTTLPYASRQNSTRPIIVLTESDNGAFTQIFADYVDAELRSSGLK